MKLYLTKNAGRNEFTNVYEVSLKEDLETIMAAVLLDREGKFHIFHDYSVPQYVDFSTLA